MPSEPRETINASLARIDERTKSTDEKVDAFAAELKSIAEHYVTQDEFRPIKTIVYGMVGVALLSVATALVALVIRGGFGAATP